jgi:hypothetical protein
MAAHQRVAAHQISRPQQQVEKIHRTLARFQALVLIDAAEELAVEHCRKEIRRELIRRVVETMLQTGL